MFIVHIEDQPNSDHTYGLDLRYCLQSSSYRVRVAFAFCVEARLLPYDLIDHAILYVPFYAAQNHLFPSFSCTVFPNKSKPIYH
jgi:hypothetical protein